MIDEDYEKGFIDGWQSLRPGSLPAIPSYAVPAGKTPYQHGYDKGREYAENE